MHQRELTSGALKYKMGKGYKECRNPEELNDWTREERLSKCGYLNMHWNQMGNTAGSQLRVECPANNNNTFVFVGEKVKKKDVSCNSRGE